MMRLWQLFSRYTSQALWVAPFSAIVLELILYRLVDALGDMLGPRLYRF